MHADFTAGLHDVAERHVLADPPDEPSTVAAVLLERFHTGQLPYP